MATATATKKPETTVNPWDEKVTVHMPRAKSGEEKSLFACVNGRSFNIPLNGKAQELPRPIAEVVLQHMDHQAEEAEYIDSIPNMG